MIINVDIPFSRRRKMARTYCKIVTALKIFLAKKSLLKHLPQDGMDIDYREIPVIINNFNRLSCLKELIEWFEKTGMKNIYIIDNHSNYKPLIDYYVNCKHTVISLSANIGYKSLWDTGIYLWFKGLPYIYTDPDVLPTEQCPLDAIEYLLKILKQYEHEGITKVGFALKIDDLPDFYPKKKAVIALEKLYWSNEIEKNIYKADIDTTLALYMPNSKGQQWGSTLRIGGQYVFRHLPWYENPEISSEEELNYRNSTIGSSWY